MDDVTQKLLNRLKDARTSMDRWIQNLEQDQELSTRMVLVMMTWLQDLIAIQKAMAEVYQARNFKGRN